MGAVEWGRFDYPDFVVRGIAYPAGTRMPRHDHPYANVTAVMRGEIIEEADGAEHRGRSCSVVVKPAGTPHSDLVIGPGPLLTIAVELRARSELALQAKQACWSWFEEADTVRAALTLRRAMRGGCDVRQRAHEFLAVALTPVTNVAPPWLAFVIQKMEARRDGPMRFDAMAAEVGLHPSYVSRAFRRATGRSMTEYARDVRLRDARHLLASTRRPLSAIAAHCGFVDASHLSRVFGRAHAVSPGAYRQICNSPSQARTTREPAQALR